MYKRQVPEVRDVIISRDVLFKPERVLADSIILNSLDNNNKETEENEIITPKNNKLLLKNESNEFEEREPLQSSNSDNNQTGRQLRCV